MLMIRLQRIGRKKTPSYRFVVSEKNKDTQSGSLEILGQYDPTKNPKLIDLKTDKIKYWLSKGAQCSQTVNNLLVNAGVLSGSKKQKSVSITKKRQTKLDTKKAASEEAKKAAAEAKKAAEEAEKVAAQAPAPEPVAEEPVAPEASSPEETPVAEPALAEATEAPEEA